MIELNKIKDFIELKENEEFNKRLYKIYTLTNPFTNICFYVGCTISPMHLRIRQHIETRATQSGRDKDRVMDSILNNGILPKIEVLYTFENKENARIVEKYLINFLFNFKSEINLLNVRSTGKI